MSMCSSPKLEKAIKQILLPKGPKFFRHLDLSLVRMMWDFCYSELQDNKCVLL